MKDSEFKAAMGAGDLIGDDQQQNDQQDQKMKPSDPRKIIKYSDEDVDNIIARKLARLKKQQQNNSGGADPAGGAPGSDPEQALAERERTLAERERRFEARSNLAEIGIPESGLELLNYSSDESFKASREALDAFVNDLLDHEAKRRATGRAPKDYGCNNQGKPDGTRKAFGL